jgi:hypothetical protein
MDFPDRTSVKDLMRQALLRPNGLRTGLTSAKSLVMKFRHVVVRFLGGIRIVLA